MDPKPGRKWDVAMTESKQAESLWEWDYGFKDLGGCGLCIITPGIQKDQRSQWPCPPAVLKQNENCTEGLDFLPSPISSFLPPTAAHFKENVTFKKTAL